MSGSTKGHMRRCREHQRAHEGYTGPAPVVTVDTPQTFPFGDGPMHCDEEMIIERRRATNAPGSHCPIGPHEPLQFCAEVGAHSVQLVRRGLSVEEEPCEVRLIQLTLVLLRE